MDHRCCHDRGDHLNNYQGMPVDTNNPSGDAPFVICNTSNEEMSPSSRVVENIENSHHNPCSCSVKRYVPRACQELHCHTPHRPCVCCPEQIRSEEESEPTRPHASTDKKGLLDCEKCNKHSRANVSYDPEPPRKELVVNTPNGTVTPCSTVVPHTPYRAPAHSHYCTEKLVKHQPENEFKKSPEAKPSSVVNNETDPASREFVRCQDQQTSHAIIKSEAIETSRGLECTNEAEPICRTIDPLKPCHMSESHDNTVIDCPSLNHLTFKEKQLALSAVAKASSNMACANMLQERDRKKSGSIGRRDFQTVMDKTGLLKNMSSREIDAVFKGFLGDSEMEMDYNKFICACRSYSAKGNSPKNVLF